MDRRNIGNETDPEFIWRYLRMFGRGASRRMRDWALENRRRGPSNFGLTRYMNNPWLRNIGNYYASRLRGNRTPPRLNSRFLSPDQYPNDVRVLFRKWGSQILNRRQNTGEMQPAKRGKRIRRAPMNNIMPNGTGLFKISGGFTTTNNGIRAGFPAPAYYTSQFFAAFPIHPCFYNFNPLIGNSSYYSEFQIIRARVYGTNTAGTTQTGSIILSPVIGCQEIDSNAQFASSLQSLPGAITQSKNIDFDVSFPVNQLKRQWWPVVPTNPSEFPGFIAVFDPTAPAVALSTSYVIMIELDVRFRSQCNRPLYIMQPSLNNFDAGQNGFQATPLNIPPKITGSGLILNALAQVGSIDTFELMTGTINTAPASPIVTPQLHNGSEWDPVNDVNCRGTFDIAFIGYDDN